MVTDGRSVAAAVVIGRNEGSRLLRCLDVLRSETHRIVYVDSGSTDASVAEAGKRGAEVVVLDPSGAFTAARARNAGIAHLRATGSPRYVQFVDGDCELHVDWLKTAIDFLDANPRVGVVCGRRRERYPEASIYNRMCDLEWDTPLGRTSACGGDALVRMEALNQVQGFDPGLIAGEEPELCIRLRRHGWEIWRLDAEMTLHDADMKRFSQWWTRSRRSGFAAIEGFAMHGGPPEWHGAPTVVRAAVWGAILPVTVATVSLAVGPGSLLLLAAYPLQVVRIALREGNNLTAWQHASLLTLGKFAELTGMVEYLLARGTGRKRPLIEYK